MEKLTASEEYKKHVLAKAKAARKGAMNRSHMDDMEVHDEFRKATNSNGARHNQTLIGIKSRGLIDESIDDDSVELESAKNGSVKSRTRR